MRWRDRSNRFMKLVEYRPTGTNYRNVESMAIFCHGKWYSEEQDKLDIC